MTALYAACPDPEVPPVVVRVGGLDCAFDLSGALWLERERTLVVADLHLEKGSSRARRGFMLPPYDTRETLARLAAVVARFAPDRVIALGDSFHDVGGPARLGDEERAALAALQAERCWTWITGNHDRAIAECVGGEVVDWMEIEGVRLCHEPGAGAGPELAGHLHPVGKVVLRGRGVRRRCFATDGTRCILPAFGAYEGGLNVCDPAFRPLFPADFTAHMLGDGRIYAVRRALLCGD